MSFCDITKAKSRFSGLQTTQRKSGKPIDFHVAYKGRELLFFGLKILFNWKIIVVEVTETFLSPWNYSKKRARMARERFWWGPSVDRLRDSRNGALWLEHYKLGVKVVNDHGNILQGMS